MKRINIRIVISFLVISLVSAHCGQNTLNSYSNEKYQEYKNHFDVKFTKHFPEKIEIENSKERNAVFSSMDSVKNDFSLILYEYGVDSKDIQGVLDKVSKNIVAQYKSSDTSLLIVNRFETIQTYQTQELPQVIDSSLINRTCYVGKLPIPNFVNYEYYDSSRVLRLDSTFEIYVLAAKAVKSWKGKFNMEPLMTMPPNWRNGYSKGIAVSQKKNTIIYWVVIW